MSSVDCSLASCLGAWLSPLRIGGICDKFRVLATTQVPFLKYTVGFSNESRRDTRLHIHSRDDALRDATPCPAKDQFDSS